MLTGLTALMIEGLLDVLLCFWVLISLIECTKTTYYIKVKHKAEYKTVVNTTKEIMWIQTLLQEIGIDFPRAAKLWCDNIRAEYLSANHVFHARTKHIEVDYHFVKEQASKKLLDIDLFLHEIKLQKALRRHCQLDNSKFSNTITTQHICD